MGVVKKRKIVQDWGYGGGGGKQFVNLHKLGVRLK